MKRLLKTGCVLAMMGWATSAVAFDETTSYVDRAFLRIEKHHLQVARNGESVPATIQVESYDALQNREIVRIPVMVSVPRGAQLSGEEGAQIGLYNVERKSLAELFGEYRAGGPAAKVFSENQLGYHAQFNSHGIFLSNLHTDGSDLEERGRATASAAPKGVLIAPALESEGSVSLEHIGASRSGVVQLGLEQAVREIRF